MVSESWSRLDATDAHDAQIYRRFANLFSIDYRSLAAFRILSAYTLIHVCVTYSRDLRKFFSNDGVLSVSLLNQYFPNHRFSILEYLPSPIFLNIFWCVLLISAVCLLIGYRSRIAAALCFVIYLSFVGRNPVINHSGDTLLPLLLFWAIFLPTGRIFGIDGALEQGRNLSRDPRVLSVASAGLLFQALYVYVFGALLKTGESWADGQAVNIALHAEAYATAAAHVLREYVVVTLLLTYFVFYLEILTPVLLFFPDKQMRVRAISVSVLMLMHLGFRICLNIGHLWLASLASLTAYIPSQVWDGIAARYWNEEQRKIRIYYDRDCGFCFKTSLLLREFFLPHDVFIGPAQDDPHIGELLERENSWVVLTPTGQKLLHWNALIFVTRQSLIMRPVWLLVVAIGAIGLGNALYNLIGRNRRSLGRVTSALLVFNTGPNSPHAVTKLVLAVVMMLTFIWNVDENHSRRDRSEWLKALAPALSKMGLSQRWIMFAPNPPLTDGYAVISLRDDLDREIYLTADGSLNEAVEHPERLERYFSSWRWLKYFNRIAKYKGKKRIVLIESFARVMCSEIRSDMSSSFHSRKIAIYWKKNTSFRQKEGQYTMEKIGEWPCLVSPLGS